MAFRSISRLAPYLAALIIGLGVLALWSMIGASPYVLFSNDGPLGSQHSAAARVPEIYYGPVWHDLNWLGYEDPNPCAIMVSSGLRTLCWYGVMPIMVAAGMAAATYAALGGPFRADWIRKGMGFICFACIAWTVAMMIVGHGRYEVLDALVSLDGIVFVAGLVIIVPLTDPP